MGPPPFLSPFFFYRSIFLVIGLTSSSLSSSYEKRIVEGKPRTIRQGRYCIIPAVIPSPLPVIEGRLKVMKS